MPKGISGFSLRNKICEESVRKLMKYFSSYDVLFVGAVCYLLSLVTPFRRKNITALGDPMAWHKKYIRCSLYICVFHI
jgi:hypothetical protein